MKKWHKSEPDQVHIFFKVDRPLSGLHRLLITLQLCKVNNSHHALYVMNCSLQNTNGHFSQGISAQSSGTKNNGQYSPAFMCDIPISINRRYVPEVRMYSSAI